MSRRMPNSPRLTPVAYQMEPPYYGVEIQRHGPGWAITIEDSLVVLTFGAKRKRRGPTVFPTPEAAAEAYRRWFEEQAKEVSRG